MNCKKAKDLYKSVNLRVDLSHSFIIHVRINIHFFL